MNASFAAHSVEPGSLALLSQSGAICSAILDLAASEKIGFSHFVSVGSMADLDFADMIDYLGNDPSARSIIIYMENMTRHRKFMSAARSVSRVKPIIVVKAGRSDAAAKAAASHTGALAGQDEAYNAAFRRAGIIRVETINQLFSLCGSPGQDAAAHRRQAGHHHQRRWSGGHGGGCFQQMGPRTRNAQP